MSKNPVADSLDTPSKVVKAAGDLYGEVGLLSAIENPNISLKALREAVRKGQSKLGPVARFQDVAARVQHEKAPDVGPSRTPSGMPYGATRPQPARFQDTARQPSMASRVLGGIGKVAKGAYKVMRNPEFQGNVGRMAMAASANAPQSWQYGAGAAALQNAQGKIMQQALGGQQPTPRQAGLLTPEQQMLPAQQAHMQAQGNYWNALAENAAKPGQQTFQPPKFYTRRTPTGNKYQDYEFDTSTGEEKKVGEEYAKEEEATFFRQFVQGGKRYLGYWDPVGRRMIPVDEGEVLSAENPEGNLRTDLAILNLLNRKALAGIEGARMLPLGDGTFEYYVPPPKAEEYGKNLYKSVDEAVRERLISTPAWLNVIGGGERR